MKNSKKIVAISLYVVSLLSLNLIPTRAKSAEFGVRYMPTFSSFELQSSSGETVTGNSKLGYGIGTFIGLNFNDYVGFQGEIIYNSISQKYSELNVDRTINLKYINIPLLLSLNTGKSASVNFNMVAGPQIGLNVGSSIITSGSNDNGTNTTQAVVSVKKSDLGLAYGVGLDFALTPSHTIRLGIGFRGVYGLIDISDNSKTIANNSYYVLDRAHIRTYSGYIGLSFIL